MLPLFIIVIAATIWGQFLTLNDGLRDLDRTQSALLRQARSIEAAEAMARYVQETHAYPATLAVLTTVQGYEHLRSTASDPWMRFEVSPVIADGVWRFQRAVLYSTDPTRTTSYTSTNTCGTGDAATATSWCGGVGAQWVRFERREEYVDEIAAQRQRFHRSLQKFADYYSGKSGFPSVDRLGAALATDSSTTLRDLVGYTGAANNCSGGVIYQWAGGLPVDCDDMYDIWGNPVSYQFTSTKAITLISESPLVNKDGVVVVVAADLRKP